MEPTPAPPSPTPPLDRRLPRRAPRTLTLLAAAAFATGTGLVVDRARRQVRAMRAAGAVVPALHHDIDLAGLFPPRWMVVLGDSAAAGHGIGDPELALPRRVGRGLVDVDGRATAVRSVAVDGATTAKVLALQVDAVAGAEVVVIGVGVNDAVRPRHRIEEVADATRALLLRVLALASPDARVVLLGCPDLSLAPGLPLILRPAVGWRCRAIAAAQQQVAAELGIPVVAARRDEVRAELFGEDGFHPGPEANRLLAARVVDQLTTR